MRTELEGIIRKINVNHIGEETEWKQGYEAGLYDAVESIEKGICNLITPGNNYFVIMYQNGDRHFPYIEEMHLYKITRAKKNKYYFSRKLFATIFNTKEPDLILNGDEQVKKRVFFTKEFAEKTIEGN